MENQLPSLQTGANELPGAELYCGGPSECSGMATRGEEAAGEEQDPSASPLLLAPPPP